MFCNLQKQILFSFLIVLQVKGMNALFGLHLQISVGESLIVGTAVRTKFVYKMTAMTNFYVTYPSNQ